MAEFAAACEKAMADLHGRELLVDLKNLTAISPKGESALLQLMRKNVKFQCGIFMKELLKQLARKSRIKHRPAGDSGPGEKSDGGETV